ncbi:hypothetical protein SLS64_011556 [Diaporthe eres]|uniref:Uncharacterized protein n=1 Tax=Diaporthe eres TaxID=83184 RepID=A0ABR1P063_DIAER
MIPHSRSRLAVTVVMFVLQSLIFILELLIFTRRVRRTSWYRPLRQLVSPVLISSTATVAIPVAFANASSYVDGAAEQCGASVDGDIGGQGVQIAVWAQVGVLLAISVLGSFHTSATGAKEVGAGLVLTHASLSIALLTQMRLGTLSSADAIVGSMILDAQNVGLCIQLAAKETLAARWQVTVVVLTQAFGLVVIPVLVSNFTHGTFANDECRCLTVFWWAWLSSCGSTAGREMPVFWTYYACRSVGFVQTSFHSLYNTSKFDKAEKSERAVPDDWNQASDRDAVDEEELLSITELLRETEERGEAANNNYPDQAQNDTEEKTGNRGRYASRGIRLRRVTHLYRRRNGQVVYFREYPATVTLMYTVYGAFSLTSLATAQTTVANFNLKPPSPIDSVGQVVSLIIAVSTLGRAAWLFFMLFRGESRSGKWNFVWPFKWHVNNDRLRAGTMGDHVFCSPPSREPNLVSLGSFLTEPFDPTSRVGASPQEPEGVESLQEHGVSFEVFTATTIADITMLGWYRKAHNEWLTADSLRTSSFDPRAPSLAPYVARRLRDELLVAGAEQTQGLYMVTGVKFAGNLAIYGRHSENMHSFDFRPDPEDVLFSSRGVVLLAYRLHMVRWSRRERAFVLGRVYRPEEDW